MKKYLLVVAASALSLCLYAQTTKLASPLILDPIGTDKTVGEIKMFGKISGSAYKTTSTPDTVVMVNTSGQLNNTTYKYYADNTSPLDSGYYLGTNVYGYKGWAESYNITVPMDTSISVIGTYSVWHGAYVSGTTKKVNIKIWNLDTTSTEVLHSAATLTGLPNTTIDSQLVPIGSLRMGINNANDTFVTTLFHNPIAVQGAFFIGYELKYGFYGLSGDTLCMRATLQGTGVGHRNYYYLKATGDTVFHSRNAIELSTGEWRDLYWDTYLNVNLAILPIVVIRDVTGIAGIAKNDLVFYGNYPNPASSSTNIKFSIKRATSISIKLMDINGRVLNEIVQDRLSPGEHIVPLSTQYLAPGNYLYTISTAEGDGISSLLTISK